MTAVDVHPSYCQSCGSIVSGRFCSHCGVEYQPASAKGPVRHLVNEFLGDGTGYVGTLLAILRSPVHGTLKLAESPAYRGYKSFFFTNSAVNLAIASAVYRSKPVDENASDLARRLAEVLGNYSGLVFNITQYVGVFGGFLVGYWIFQSFGIKRSAGAFFKLTCLMAGFSALLNIIIQLPNAGLFLFGFDVLGGNGSPLRENWGTASSLLGLFLIYYTSHCQKLFWQLSIGRLILSVLSVFVVTVAIILVQFFMIAEIATLIHR